MRLNKLLLLILVTLPFVVQAQGEPTKKVIRSISIQIDDVFEEPDGSFYRGANSLKINTRKEVVLRELLVKEGDEYNEFALRESERNLRSLGYLDKVSITPTFDGDSVDLLVKAHDTWTLIPSINYSSGSGSERRSAGISESNLAGHGKRLEFLYDDNDGRESIEGVWDDNRLWGTHKRMVLGAFAREDGHRVAGFLGRPFRSLLETKAWFISADSSDLVDKLYANGDERYIFRAERQDFSVRYTRVLGEPTPVPQRFTLGFRFSEDDFTEADIEDYRDVNVNPNSVSQDPALLAEDRRFVYPFASYQRVEPDFISMAYIDRFERIEDFNLGNNFFASAGVAPEAFGSDEQAGLLSLNDSDGWRFGDTSFMRAEFGAATRIQEGGLQNSTLRGDIKYYNRLGDWFAGSTFLGRHTVAAALSLDYARELDRDQEFLLGADDGLRGYETNTFYGDKRFLLNLEERFHLYDDVFQLVSIGGAFFADVGGATTGSLGRLFTDELYADIGFGLRFALPRSTGARVVRIDFAFPLRDGPDGSNSGEIRILFIGGQAFSSQLRSDSFGAEQSSIQVGLDN